MTSQEKSLLVEQINQIIKEDVDKLYNNASLETKKKKQTSPKASKNTSPIESKRTSPAGSKKATPRNSKPTSPKAPKQALSARNHNTKSLSVPRKEEAPKEKKGKASAKEERHAHSQQQKKSSAAEKAQKELQKQKAKLDQEKQEQMKRLEELKTKVKQNEKLLTEYTATAGKTMATQRSIGRNMLTVNPPTQRTNPDFYTVATVPDKNSNNNMLESARSVPNNLMRATFLTTGKKDKI